jgi:TetR/AcrR family transcriptional regulator
MTTLTAPQAARTAILDAASELFATKGLTATTIKAIGAEAGVNSALIYYYFADKAALYRAVLEQMSAAFPGRLADEAGGAKSPVAGLSAVIRMQAEVFLAQPLFPRLIARELADHGAEHATPVVKEQGQRLMKSIAGLIRAGQQAGDFRDDLEAELLAVSVLSQMNWFCIAGPVIETILGRDGVTTDPDSVRGYADHVVRFSMAALQPVHSGSR